eukprot:7116208-Pyramimonas_sp.AAC.1
MTRAGDFAHNLLYNVYRELQAGRLSNPHFNEGDAVFLAKGSEQSDRAGLSRSPDKTRPITLSNSDNKLISAAINAPMGYACQLSCVDFQRGFVKNRSMSQNLVQLE